LEAEPVKNVRNQIGFCGIWCGSCASGNGAIIEMAKRFEKTVKGYGLEKWVPKDFNFKEFMKGLGSLQATAICTGCRKGGGPPNCTIRICALEKRINDCSECNQLAECDRYDRLTKNYPTIKQDLMKLKNRNQAELIAKWTTEIRTKFPHCLVYDPSFKE